MIVFAGDSHIRAIAHGFMRLPREERRRIEDQLGGVSCAMLGPAFTFAEPFWEWCDEGLRFSGVVNDRFANALGSGNAVIRKKDPRHFVFSLASQPSYLHMPGMLDRWTTGWPEQGVAHVSETAFAMAVVNYTRHVFALFEALKTLGVSFSVMPAPPPSDRFALIKKYGDRGLVLWRLHERVIAQELEKRGVAMEALPFFVFEGGDQKGFLRKVLCDTFAEGSPHGNAWYGELFLRALFARRGKLKSVLSRARIATIVEQIDSPRAELDWTCRLGFSLANRRQNAKAIFVAALTADPADRRAKFGLGYACERLGETTDAELQYRELVEAHPKWADGWMVLGRICFSRRKYEEAAKAFETARSLDNNRTDWPLHYAATLEKLNRAEEARALLKSALFGDAAETGNQPTLKLEWRQFEAPAKPAGDAAFFPARMVEEPDPFDSALAPQLNPAAYLVVLGRIESALGKLDFAEHCFSLALSLDETHPEWNSYLGDIHLRRRQWREAADRYQVTLERFPKIAAYAKRLGIAYERQKKIAAARAVYLQAVVAHPTDVDFVDALKRVTIPAVVK